MLKHITDPHQPVIVVMGRPDNECVGRGTLFLPRLADYLRDDDLAEPDTGEVASQP